MTLSTVLILYVVGMVVTFILVPFLKGTNKPDTLFFVCLFFPLFWLILISIFVWAGFNALAQMYIDYLEKRRNEK